MENSNSNSSVDVKELVNSIKRTFSAYWIFYQEQLENLKNREPKMSYVEMTKLSSERWRSVDQNVKDHYYRHATMDKERYRHEVAAAGLMGKPTLPDPKFVNFSVFIRRGLVTD